MSGEPLFVATAMSVGDGGGVVVVSGAAGVVGTIGGFDDVSDVDAGGGVAGAVGAGGASGWAKAADAMNSETTGRDRASVDFIDVQRTQAQVPFR